jgi:hypothetical protein
MTCSAILIRLVVESLSAWTMTGIPVALCTYDVGGVRFTERQFYSCSAQPRKVPEQVLRVATHNSCAEDE